jgi:hypothetical protein
MMRFSNQNLLAELGWQTSVTLNGLQVNVLKHGRIATSPLAYCC